MSTVASPSLSGVPDALILLTMPNLLAVMTPPLASTGVALFSAHDIDGLARILDEQAGRHIRLVCVCFGTIVPATLLDRCTAGAINLHPATPEYPGSGGLHLALYDQAATFGATAHVMEAIVDSGTILVVRRFAIPPGIGHLRLGELAPAAIRALLAELAPALAGKAAFPALPDEHWAGPPHRIAKVMALAKLTPDMSRQEVMRRWQAFRDLPDSPLHMDFHGLHLRHVAPGPRRIRGWFDGVHQGHANGWAYDPAGGPARVQLRINGENSVEILANLERPDVADAGHGDGRCGFSIPLQGLLPQTGSVRIDLVLPDDAWSPLPGTPVWLP